MSSPPQAGSKPVEINVSRYFMPWLQEQQLSLAFTTYQSSRLFLIGLKQNGRLSVFERLFDRAMGLAAGPERLYLSSRYQLWQFDHTLPPGQTHNGYDRLYVPRIGYTTGDLDIHDIAVDAQGQVIFVNTMYSCLATLSPSYSFKPLWQPPFISRLAPEDRCHLNGLAMDGDKPRYVTAVSRSDVPSGWRERRQDGGCVIDVDSNEIVATGLSMPHSPRLYKDKLWLLNSGTGDFGYIDLPSGRFQPVAFCPGYGRGLAFHNNLALIGLSRPREKTFSGLALDERLAAKDAVPRCGLLAVDLDSGNIVHWLELEGVVTELYDVQVLPGVRQPMALGFKTNEINRLISIDEPAGVTFHALTNVEPGPAQSASRNPAPQPAPAANNIRYTTSASVTLNAVLTAYEALTFPNLRQRAWAKKIRGPLSGVIAMQGSQTVGLALAEPQSGGHAARLISLMVLPQHRGQGIGLGLLAQLEQLLAGQGCKTINLTYRANWLSAAAVERLLQKQGWAAPQTQSILCKFEASRLAQAPGLKSTRLPAGLSTFPWADLPLQEQKEIQRQQESDPWYPYMLTPFQEVDRLEPLNSLGLRYQDQVVGWIITHRISQDMIQYTSLFVKQDMQRLGWPMILIAQALQRQLEAGVSNGMSMADVKNTPMVKVIDRLEPFLTTRTESRVSQKILG